jgi:hypothetical protein
MVDLRWEPGGDLILSWTDAPGARSNVITRAEIGRLQQLADAVSVAENGGRTAAIVASRTVLSTALYELLDGPERALGQRIESAEAQARRLDLIVRAQTADRRALREHPATWMRWELLRLVGYGVLYDTAHLDKLPKREDLTLVLVVASVTPTLRDEIQRMGWTLTPLGGGYARIEGVLYTCFVVVIDEVSEAERDEYLRLFSHRPASPGEATRWLQQWMRDTKMKQPDIEELPGFEELFQKTIEAMPAEKRLAGLAPEERVAGLTPEQVLLLMPLDALRVLPEEYLRSLPIEVQERIRKRLQEAAH